MFDITEYYIFGAHPRGYTMYQYLRTLEPERKALGFIYNNDEKNPDEIEQIRVYDLNSSLPGELNTDAVVYIATRGVFHDGIRAALLAYGFQTDNILSVTPALDIELRNEYVRKVYEAEGRKFEKLEANSEISGPMAESDSENDGSRRESSCVFVAKTVFDKDFSKEVPLKSYESVIQAGSSTATEKLGEAKYYDDNGEGISERNNQFCELTALYWIWKHANQDIIGLEHWRRRFLLPDTWQNLMAEKQIDVILPVPLCVMPSLEENYRSRHVEAVWDKTMEILRKRSPEDAEPAARFFREKNLYSPCNMMIARRDVLRDYCSWLFPILLELNDEVGKLEDSYQNRYPGFVSERLLNYYFEKNQEKYHVVYADKSFLS